MSFQTYNNTYLSPFHKIAYWLYEMIRIGDEMINDKIANYATILN